MIKIHIHSPTIAYLSCPPEELSLVERQLKYTNTANQHLLRRHQNNFYWKRSNREAWEARLEELKSEMHKTLLFKDAEGRPFIRPGSIPYLVFPEPPQITSDIVYPTPKKIAWAKPLPFELYPYQEESWQRLLEAKHANVELATGTGKSATLMKLCREAGLRTAIVTPSKAIFEELLDKFETHFGRANVGAFGAGKKKLGKRFTICIGDSLANIKPNTPEWEFFNDIEMLAIDESHSWGAESLEAVCHGVLANVPYRFFFSATQTRGDGGEKLLQSIIGPTVFTLSTSEAVAGGYICPHDFTVIETVSSNPHYQSNEALEMKRTHLLRNKNIAAFIAKLANSTAPMGLQTLVLVEELSQIAMLKPLLQAPLAYAHSESKPDRLSELGLEKVNPLESVEKFNKGEAMVLIGTSCIATGTNIFPTHQTINWIGGASEVRSKQGPVGRAIRLGSANPWASRVREKTIAKIYDFDVVDIGILRKHLEKRIEFYQDSGSEIRRVKLKKSSSSDF